MAGDASTGVSRRTVLQATSGLAATAGVTGLASAAPDDTVEVNVGFTGASVQADLEANYEVRQSFTFNASTMRMTAQEAAELRRREDVRYVEENGKMYKLGSSVPWGIDRVGATTAHDNGYTGEGASVAVIDTGVDSTHPEFQGILGDGYAPAECGSGGFLCSFLGNGHPCEEPWDDDHNHGTHCAGSVSTVDEEIPGVSVGATIHPVKVLNCMGSGDMSDVAAGIEWTADQGIDIASMSLGSPDEVQVVSDAVEYAASQGVLLIAAAGNEGEPDSVGWPAAHEDVIAVSATSEDDSMASFSSVGPEVDIAAPGEDVNSAVYGGYDTFSGTSMACPHVSGAAAQLMALGLDADDTVDVLLGTAEDIGHSENEQGAGLLDVWAAIEDAGEPGDPDEGPEIVSFSVDAGEVLAEFDASDADGDVEVTLTLVDDGGNSDEESTVA